jgi:hypothetical protein
MARRPNYGFEKRQKELERQKKKDAKALKKQQRREGDAGAAEDGGEAPANGDVGAAPEQDRGE